MHALRELGLSQSETTIYLSLLDIGSCRAGPLAKRTKLDRTTVYKALNNLITKGLASSAVKENRKYFEPANPNAVLEYLEREERILKEKRREIKNVLPELNKRFHERNVEPEATVFKSRRGIRAVFDNMMQTIEPNDEYLVFGIPKYAEDFLGYFREFNKVIKEKRALGRLIFDERATDAIEASIQDGHKVKTLSKEFMSPAEVNIYGDNVAIVLWDDPLAIVIRSKGVAHSFRTYFDVLWKTAKPLKRRRGSR